MNYNRNVFFRIRQQKYIKTMLKHLLCAYYVRQYSVGIVTNTEYKGYVCIIIFITSN